jgi:tRNA threonylcarbamoyladenosine biosynthesis protein TsaE
VAEEKTASLKSELAGEHLTASDEETFELGRKMGEQLAGKAVLLLSGDLGAGKTVFTKGLGAGLGIPPEDVTSPSFTIINIYDGRLPLYHVDLYRLEAGACRELGLEEMLEEQAVVAIEWPERLGYTPAGAVEVAIEYLDEARRRISIRKPAGDLRLP